MRITRPFVLLALAALLAPRAEASRTSVWESNPPAAVLTTTNATGLLAPLAPTGPLESIVADAELVEPPRFGLGEIVLIEKPRENSFRIGLADVVEPPALRGPPALDEDPHQAFELRDPETRIRGLELLPPFRIGASASLSLWPHQACGFSCREVVSDSRYDPWGLLSEEELQARYYADVQRMSSYAAVVRDQARRRLQQEQDQLQSERRSLFGSVVDEVTGAAEAKYQGWRQMPQDVRAAVQEAWKYRPNTPLDPDLIAAGGDYGRRTAIRLSEEAGDVQGALAAGGTQVAQDYVTGKALVYGVGAVGAAVATASRERTYITYAFRNAAGEVVYVGRARGVGTPEQVLKARIGKGHHILKKHPDLVPEVIDMQKTLEASKGAEQHWYQYYTDQGAKLLNDPKTPPLSNKPSKAKRTAQRLRTYIDEDLNR